MKGNVITIRNWNFIYTWSYIYSDNILVIVLVKLSIPLNKIPLGAAYMLQWIESALAQIMACCYSAPSQYVNQWWVIVNWTIRKKLQWNFNQNRKLFIHEKWVETIRCDMHWVLGFSYTYINDLVQDGIISSAFAMEILSSVTKPSI